MSKFIIYNNDESIGDYEAVSFIRAVISEGKVSETSRGKQYCFATRFKSGVVVTCNKLREDTFTFRVKREV